MKNVTAIIANYNYPKATVKCVKSFRKFYPDVPIIVVDDYSENDGYSDLREKLSGIRNIITIQMMWHTGHGLAIDAGVRFTQTDYVLTLRS